MRRQTVQDTLDALDRAAADKSEDVTDEQFAAMTTAERTAHNARRTWSRLEQFAEYLLSWNFVAEVEDPETGEMIKQPVPATAAGLAQLDDTSLIELRAAYDKATAPRVAPPLPQPSNGGEPSEAVLELPMEPL